MNTNEDLELLRINEAEALQIELRNRVDQTTSLRVDEIHHICGLDVAYHKVSNQLIAGAVVLSFPELKVIEKKTHIDVARFPYIPGLFSFRELPPLLEVIKLLKSKIDLFVCDGQGIAHPRQFGLACHLGVTLDIPTIGCGKSRLCGYFEPPNIERASHSDLTENGEIIGRVLRTQNDIKPIFISVGHKCTLENATEIILKLTENYRLPQTTRLADQLVKSTLKAFDDD